MARTLTAKNMYDQKFKVYEFDGVYLSVFGKPSVGGCWIIYGKEKNGKTWAALLLADYLRHFDNVWYISAEEGTDIDFVAAMQRAKIPAKCKGLNFSIYQTPAEIRERLDKKRGAPGIIILDNATVYTEDFKARDFQKLISEYPHTLFIIIAHEERGEPYTALAKYARKMAKRIVRVRGLACEVSGRGPGGTIIIDEEKATLFHGDQILNR